MSIVKKTFLIISYIFIIGKFPSFAEYYNFKSYTIEDGLPQSQILSMIQDRNGYIWFGTYGGGACKFDGVNFTNYSTKDSLINDVVTAMFEDSKGNIWFGTHRGLSKFDGKKFTNFIDVEGLSEDNILCIFEDHQKNLWIGTARTGVKKFDGEKFTSYDRKDGLSSNYIYSGIADDKGRVWLGTYGGGLSMFDGKSFTNYSTMQGLNDNMVFAVYSDSHSNIWVGTGNGVSKFDGKNFINYSVNDGLLNPIVRAICEDNNGNFWFGTNGGVSKFNGERFFNFSENEGLCQNKVRSLLHDREGNIWIGTNGGVSKFSGTAFTMISTNDGLCNNEVLSIIEDSEGNYWFGTSSGVSKFSPDEHFSIKKENFLNYFIEDGLSTNIIWTQLEDKNKNIWFGTNRGGICKLIYSEDEKKHRQAIPTLAGITPKPKFITYSKSENELPNNIIYSLVEDLFGNIWIATNRGISIYDGEKFTNYYSKNGLVGNIVSTIISTKDGKIIIGTNTGLSICDAVQKEKIPEITFTNIDESNGLLFSNIYTLKEDNKGNIWLGTFGGGIHLMKNEIINNFKEIKTFQFEKFDDTDGLSDNSIVLMEFDKNGYLWMGTIKGINRLNTPLYFQNGKKQFKFYGKDEGFRGIECNINSVCKDSKGNLWFGTIKGAYIYNPEEDNDNKVPPVTHITNLRLFYETVNLDQYAESKPSTDSKLFSGDSSLSLGMTETNIPSVLNFPYSQNHVTFDFIGISLAIPEKVKYQYQLEGFDKNWSPYTSQNHATYSNLQAGKYTFKVKSCNNDGFWNDEPATCSIIITPPFWKTWWFVSLLLLLAGGSIYTLHNLRIRNIENDKKLLEQTVNTRTRELKLEKDKTMQINDELVMQKQHLESTNKIIEEKNRHITDSIIYARHIQEAIFPTTNFVTQFLPNSFGLFKPKDIVSGDFAWFNYKDGKAFIAAVDCTGHGVPGAFLSVLGNTLLHQIINDKGIHKPNEILKVLHKEVQRSLHQMDGTSEVFDGMDVAICAFEIDHKNNNRIVKVNFAGAFRPLYHLTKTGENGNYGLNIIKPDQLPVGGKNEFEGAMFTHHEITLKKDDVIYIFSDGITDQFGGKYGKKFAGKRLRDLLLSAQKYEIKKQKEYIKNSIEKWAGNFDQTDDILLIGVKI